jgi:pimeloyl-ACP methyl ester carboxylesterase
MRAMSDAIDTSVVRRLEHVAAELMQRPRVQRYQPGSTRKMDGRIDIDGVGLETRWIGPGPEIAPTILLLHEGLGCVDMWRGFPSQLAEATSCGVALYSRAGYGRSDPCRLPRPLTYMQDEARDVVPKLLDAIGFRHGLLLGHSDGASIATAYLGQRQDQRVRGLVLMAPHFFVEEMGLASIAKAREAYAKGELRARLARYHGANVDCAFRGWNDAWLDPEFRAWDIRDRIAHVRVPMLIVQGAGDEYGTIAQIDAARQRACCPVEVALLGDCGHAPHLQRPAETLAAIGEFARRMLSLDGALTPVPPRT